MDLLQPYFRKLGYKLGEAWVPREWQKVREGFGFDYALGFRVVRPTWWE